MEEEGGKEAEEEGGGGKRREEEEEGGGGRREREGGAKRRREKEDHPALAFLRFLRIVRNPSTDILTTLINSRNVQPKRSSHLDHPQNVIRDI